MESIAYAGWTHCGRIVSGDVEAVVTMNVGPRVIRLGFVGQRNELHENPAEVGKVGGSEYRSYGGHRLWIAPEDTVRTYQPENGPVEHKTVDGWDCFSIPPDQFGMQKEIRIRPLGDGKFQLQHYIRNQGDEPYTMAPWALTVMAPGGICLVPQTEFRPFPEILTPVRPLAMWSYLDMADPRFTWGTKLIRLRQQNGMQPTKVGTLVEQCYAGYFNSGTLFVKRFEHEQGKTYPDFGCNFETYTSENMLEHETLGYVRELKSGEEARHFEAWSLTRNVTLPEDEAGIAALLADTASKLPLN